ncbi:MAG: hypothetical protein ACRDN0_39600 [Trebonia sp.]
MTETSTEARPRTPSMPLGMAVGQAQAVLSQLLAGVLKETGTERETFFAPQRVARFGDAAEHEEYVNDLAAHAE